MFVNRRQKNMDFRKSPHFQGEIGATGFEPAASASRTLRSTKLSHAPPYAIFTDSFYVPSVVHCRAESHIDYQHYNNI